MADDNGKLIMQLHNMKGIAKFAPMLAAQLIALRASQIAPRDTGYMAEHITAQKKDNVAQVVSEADYSVYVEFGTYKMAAQPFMRPAVDQGRSNLLKTAGSAVMQEIKRLI